MAMPDTADSIEQHIAKQANDAVLLAIADELMVFISLGQLLKGKQCAMEFAGDATVRWGHVRLQLIYLEEEAHFLTGWPA